MLATNADSLTLLTLYHPALIHLAADGSYVSMGVYSDGSYDAPKVRCDSVVGAVLEQRALQLRRAQGALRHCRSAAGC